MGDLFTQKFWKDAAERTVSSAAQGFIVGGGLAGAAAATGQVTLIGFPWLAAAGGAGGMALLTFVKSLAAARVGDDHSASLVNLDA
ncbi:holin [Mycolicibacterium komossense]|uniref:Holin n=1 Tax=Mycolicibacterium komossense TaxID=1779 RepID=A0ABT3CM76_9MYCO|nr:holin [Mycolicibacterium komossense]MCV7230654.1 hypothetical protein [Mycolicibacterium komossense]